MKQLGVSSANQTRRGHDANEKPEDNNADECPDNYAEPSIFQRVASKNAEENTKYGRDY
jgi:hypothetical protein